MLLFPKASVTFKMQYPLLFPQCYDNKESDIQGDLRLWQGQAAGSVAHGGCACASRCAQALVGQASSTEKAPWHGGRALTKLCLFLLQTSWLEALNHSID